MKFSKITAMQRDALLLADKNRTGRAIAPTTVTGHVAWPVCPTEEHECYQKPRLYPTIPARSTIVNAPVQSSRLLQLPGELTDRVALPLLILFTGHALIGGFACCKHTAYRSRHQNDERETANDEH